LAFSIVTERSRYFFGQVLGVADLEQKLLYHREKARRHKSLPDGWGIVGGLEVRAGTKEIPRRRSHPDTRSTRCGEEIVVLKSVGIDLAGHAAGTTVYVAVRYDGAARAPCAITSRSAVRAHARDLCGGGVDPAAAAEVSRCPSGHRARARRQNRNIGTARRRYAGV
jgi:hypothetical protein